MRSPKGLARIAGLFYLVVAVLGGFAHFGVRAKVYVAGDAAATAHNVVANAGLVRFGFVADLVQATFFLLVAMTLYLLLKHVHQHVAQAMVTVVAIAVTITCLNMVHQLGALLVATDAGYASVADPDTLVLLMLDLQHYGYLIAQIFFGLWLLPLGYLVYRSGMFPRVLGVLLVLACAAYLVDALALLSAPKLGAAISPYVVVLPTIAEISLLLWLLVKGAKAPVPLPSTSNQER